MNREDPAQWPIDPTLPGGEPMSAGDPRIFAPELMPELTGFERKSVANAYVRYLRKHGGLYWSETSKQETAKTMSRAILGRGVWTASFVKATGVVVPTVYLVGACLVAQSPVSITAAVVMMLVIGVLLFRIPRRRRQALSLFDETYRNR